MKYEEMLRWLYTSSNRKIKYGLERIEHLLSIIDNPHKKYKTIHITGSKGKGSVSANLSSILKASHYKVGMYISPHLNRYTERFTVNGKEISIRTLSSIFDKIRHAIEQESWEKYNGTPSFFEITTAIAFDFFLMQNVDIAVVEVGLGGRMDATNVIMPLASVITNVDLEHTEILGNTLSLIAREKAGIIKRNIPTFTEEQKSEPLDVIKTICKERNSNLFVMNRDYSASNISISFSETEFDLKNSYGKMVRLYTPLIGDFQAYNSATATTVLQYLDSNGILRIDEESIRQGLKNTAWPGRMEIVKKKNLYVLDGAHTIESTRAITSNLKQLFSGRKMSVIFAVMKDKKVNAMVKNLSEIADSFLITTPHSSRALPPEEIGNVAKEYVKEIKSFDSVGDAIAYADNRKLPVLITGSIYLVGEARAILLKVKTDPVIINEGITEINWKDLLETLFSYYEQHSSPEPYLVVHHEDPFHVLISTIISQRTRDTITEKVCEVLFKKFSTVSDLADASIDDIEEIIKPSGFYKNKALVIKNAAKMIRDQFNGTVPSSMAQLLQIKGVGRKTAGCVLIYGYDKDELAVDTHVHRISNRLGAVVTDTPEETEAALKKIVPKQYWKYINHIMVKHGQQICMPVNPQCTICPVKAYCIYGGKSKAK